MLVAADPRDAEARPSRDAFIAAKSGGQTGSMVGSEQADRGPVRLGYIDKAAVPLRDGSNKIASTCARFREKHKR